MSAIFGIFHLDGRPVATEDLVAMGSALAMHGPDGGGQWQQQAVGLGQRLLWVTPQDRFETQPCMSPDGRICLVSDGRIDNRAEVFSALPPEAPESELTDSELIARAYEKWGRDCVHHLLGVFTFALWDARAHLLIVARSAVASPSLFYHATPTRLAFATMPKGLFALPAVARVLDKQHLADYLSRTGTAPGASFYREVAHLLPGQMIEASPGGWSVTDFWVPDLKRDIRFARDEDYVAAFTALFQRVIRDNLRSLTPVGVMMSGGLDSTAVAAIAASLYQEEGRELATYTEVPGPEFDGALIRGRYADETPYVQAMANHCANLRLNLIIPRAQSYLDDIEALFVTAEAPFRNASNRIWWEAILAAAHAQGVRTLLTGGTGNLTISWRGDGLLGALVGAGQWRQAWREARAYTRRGDGRSPLQVLLKSGIMPHLPAGVYLALDQLRTLGSGSGPQADWQRFSPIHPDFAREYHVEARARAKGRHLRAQPKLDVRAERLRAVLSAIQRGDGLQAGYQARFGVTVCDPTADVRLLEFCLAVPEEQYQRNGVTRWLIRRVMAGRLPPMVLDNPQRGLQAAYWYENLLATQTQILSELALLEKSDLARCALDLTRLRRLVQGLTAATSNPSRQMADFRGVLELGLMTGRFIRWVEAGH